MNRSTDQFLTGVLSGLYQGGIGNPSVSEARRRSALEEAYTRQQMDANAAEQGLMPSNNDGGIHPAAMEISNALVGGIARTPKYVTDPNAQFGYVNPQGDLSSTQGDGTIRLSPKQYRETLLAKSKQPIYNIVQTDSSGAPIKSTPLGKGEKPVITKPVSTGTGGKGSVQQSQLVDSHDSVPLLFDRDNRTYVRSTDGQPVIGSAIPTKGNADAVSTTSRGLELLPKIDRLFNALDKKTPIGAKAATMPILGSVLYPEETQLRNELKQVGFTFGGKNFTGNEENIIVGAMVPSWNDNKASREAKRKALKGYISGQIDLMSAANLLGASGKSVKDLLNKSMGERKATMRWNPATGKVEPY
jgi:hypothetical protein